MSCKSTAVCLCMDVHCESKSSHWVPLIPCLHWSQSFRTSPQSSPPQFAHDTEWQPAKCYCGSSQMLWKGSLCISMSPNPEKKPPRRPTRRSAFTATCKFWRLWRMRSVRHSRASEIRAFLGAFLGGWPKKMLKKVCCILFSDLSTAVEQPWKTLMTKFWFHIIRKLEATRTEPLAVSGDKREKYWILGTKKWLQNVKCCFHSSHENRFKQFLESQYSAAVIQEFWRHLMCVHPEHTAAIEASVSQQVLTTHNPYQPYH